MRNPIKISFTLFALIAVLVLEPLAATAQQILRTAVQEFSFDVYGDSRSMMYLPYKQDQEAQARELMVDMFELVLPTHVAKATRVTDEVHHQSLPAMVIRTIRDSGAFQMKIWCDPVPKQPHQPALSSRRGDNDAAFESYPSL